jgi:hypothetical protein
MTIAIWIAAISFLVGLVQAWKRGNRYDDFFTRMFEGVGVVLGALLAGAIWPITIGALIVAAVISLKDA